MVAINSIQAKNFAEALSVAKTQEEKERLAFAIWSESAGYIHANDGTNTSNSPGVTFGISQILRKSLDIPHDKVGSNGRSTGMLQQISKDVGGVWGDMAGTMDPKISASRFLAALQVTNVGAYRGYNIKPDGSKEYVVVPDLDPVAADVLRVQQPLAEEAKSSNYSKAQVEIAKAIAAQFGNSSPVDTKPDSMKFLNDLLHW